MTLLNRLLRKNVSIGQTAGYAAATLVGLTIILTAIQFYVDITTASDEDGGFVSADYLIISKKVSGWGTITGKQVEFSDAEIEDLRSQPWTQSLAPFTPARFDVNATVEMAGRGLHTAMFFEAIPDEYFDIKPDGWNYTPGESREVPIIISKDYLSLYNFGFAPTRGMPQISEKIVSKIPLTISVSGNGQQQTLTGRVVGFSSRLNTIAVPQSFLDDANDRLANSAPKPPSRLIVKLKSIGDPAAMSYMEDHGYEIAGDKSDNGRANFFLRLVTTIVIAIGAVIAVLAFFILVLSIWLVLQKNREKICGLVELGYTPAQVAVPYCRLVMIVDAVVLILALGITISAHFAWAGSLDQLGLSVGAVWMTAVIAVLLVAAITLLHIVIIRRKVRAAAR